MNQPSRFARWVRTLAAALVAAFVLTLVQGGSAYAASTTGIINGTVTDATSKAPVAGATVDAVSPTTSAHTTTNAQGFFSLAGLTPDTYTVTVTPRSGYQPVVLGGVTVNADQASTLTPTVSKTLQTIGRTASRSTAGAFQPAQTQNTYTVNAQQIATVQGNPNNISETNLLTSLPGASLDKSGYPVLRGGRENEEGYQFEGISYTDPITNQFVNSLAIHGAQSFQLIPGAGPASNGNSGTGTINVTAKRGARPQFASFDFEDYAIGAPGQQFTGEYGWATPNGRLSNYTSFVGGSQFTQYGAKGTSALDAGAFFGLTRNESRDLINNFVYKFGRDNSQSLQFLYQNQSIDFISNYGGVAGYRYISGDPDALFLIDGTGVPSDVLESIIGYFPDQGGQFAFVRPNQLTQPNETIKLEYTNNLNASTFLQLAYYKVNATAIFDHGFTGTPGFGFPNDDFLTQGGLRTGYRLDLTKQLGQKHLLQAGGRFEYLHPIDNSVSYDYGLQFLDGLVSATGYSDFVDPNAFPDYSSGYLAQYFPAGIPRIPPYFRVQSGTRGDLGYYLSDTWSPNTRLKLEYGGRVDQAVYHFYPALINNPATSTLTAVDSKYRKPSVFEPRIAATLRMGANDSVRASYGFTANFAPLGFNQRVQNPLVFAPFANVPAGGSLGTKICGPLFNAPCTSYADQLQSLYQKRVGLPYQPTLPETFANWDASYSHAFSSDVSVRVTPFYRRGYDQVVRTNVVQGFNPTTGRPVLSPTISTNNGVSRTTGVEFLLAKENRRPTGLSGTLAMTYTNEFTNVIPGTASEDFFPTVPAASLALNNVYRAGFLSPFTAVAALEYKTKSGFRLVPNITYNRGYPIGTGLITASYINGKPYNVPLTDVTGASNGVAYSQFVDPQNPGSITSPNLAATLGTGEKSSAGGLLSKANFLTNFTLEYTPPNAKRHTFGFQMFNVFNQLYGTPSVNFGLQPVATGIVGPQTQLLPSYYVPYNGIYGIAPTPTSAFGANAYNNYPNGSPRSVNVYYRVSI